MQGEEKYVSAHLKQLTVIWQGRELRKLCRYALKMRKGICLRRHALLYGDLCVILL